MSYFIRGREVFTSYFPKLLLLSTHFPLLVLRHWLKHLCEAVEAVDSDSNRHRHEKILEILHTPSSPREPDPERRVNPVLGILDVVCHDEHVIGERHVGLNEQVRICLDTRIGDGLNEDVVLLTRPHYFEHESHTTPERQGEVPVLHGVQVRERHGCSERLVGHLVLFVGFSVLQAQLEEVVVDLEPDRQSFPWLCHRPVLRHLLCFRRLALTHRRRQPEGYEGQNAIKNTVCNKHPVLVVIFHEHSPLKEPLLQPRLSWLFFELLFSYCNTWFTSSYPFTIIISIEIS